MSNRNDSDFGTLAANIGYQLRRLDVLMMADLGETLSRVGLTPARATALAYVGLHEACDQTALGNALGINRASAMATVNHLVALGVIERRSGRDRRSNALYLTSKGQQLRDEVEQLTAEQDAEFFSVLTAGEREELDRLIRKTRELNRSRRPSDIETQDISIRATPTRANLTRVK